MKNKMEQPAGGVAPDTTCYLFSGGEWLRIPAPVPLEASLTVNVNGQRLMTILCTPVDLKSLVVGFLYSEGIITGLDDIAEISIDDAKLVADARLNKDYTLPTSQTRTPSGTSFGPPAPGVVSDLRAKPEEVLALMNEMLQRQQLYQQGGGTHGSALCDRQRILVKSEDIGRHNTLDRIVGECLLKGIPTEGRILLTTGRISSEMLLKAARMQAPIVASRSSPTEYAIALGRELGITVIGYNLGTSLSVFCGEARLLPAGNGNVI